MQTYNLKQYIDKADSLHKMLFFNNPDTVMILSLKGLISNVNVKITELMGYSIEELIDKPFWTVIHKADVAPVIIGLKKVFLGEVFAQGFRVIHKNMEIRYVYMTCMPIVKDNNILGAYAIIKDVTQEQRLKEDLHYAKNYDELTKLLNEEGFHHKLKHVLYQCEEIDDCFTLMLIDISRFKFINDALGHEVGDLILKEIANRLETSFGKGAVLSRLLGDKFTILSRDIKNTKDAEKIAADIKKLFEKPFDIKDFQLYIKTSIGICLYPNDGMDTTLLMKRVQIAVKNAKKQGDNSYIFFNRQVDKNKDKDDYNYNRLILKSNLRGAIERNEFVVEYQPKIDPRSNKITGAEALVRWKHTTKGKLYPKDFLSLVEEEGFMIQLGQWTLQQVLREMNQWQKDGLSPIRVSLNFSEYQLVQEDFLKKLVSELIEKEIDARFLEIEVTEGSKAVNEEKVISVLKGIKELGVHISMDDFGRGYSSLSKLRNFSVDTLKLSQAFIKDISTGPEAIEIVSAMIKLAHSLKMRVTVGGVEKPEQLSILMKFNCDEVQGYLFSEPVSNEKLKRLIKAGMCYPKSSEEIEEEFNNRRGFFRIEFKNPLGADMSIFKIGGKKVSLGSTEVIVFDISAGGLRFLSDMKLPVKSGIVLVFETTILEKELSLYGNVVWTKPYKDQIFEYGLEFVFGEKHREAMLQLLNQLQMSIRSKKGVDNYRVVKRVYIKE